MAGVGGTVWFENDGAGDGLRAPRPRGPPGSARQDLVWYASDGVGGFGARQRVENAGDLAVRAIDVDDDGEADLVEPPDDTGEPADPGDTTVPDTPAASKGCGCDGTGGAGAGSVVFAVAVARRRRRTPHQPDGRAQRVQSTR